MPVSVTHRVTTVTTWAGGRTTTLTEAEAPVPVADSRFLDSTIHGTCFGRTMEKHRAGEDVFFFLVAIVLFPVGDEFERRGAHFDIGRSVRSAPTLGTSAPGTLAYESTCCSRSEVRFVSLNVGLGSRCGTPSGACLIGAHNSLAPE